MKDQAEVQKVRDSLEVLGKSLCGCLACTIRTNNAKWQAAIQVDILDWILGKNQKLDVAFSPSVLDPAVEEAHRALAQYNEEQAKRHAAEGN